MVSFGISEEGEGINWIRTQSVFITVIPKNKNPESLPELLLKALEFWDPLPQRLILSKFRTELDCIGVLAEENILGNKHLQAGWLNDFIEDASQEYQSSVSITVERHWESLGDKLASEVLKYSHQLANSLSGRENVQSFKFEGRQPLNYQENEKEIRLHTNHYVCSRPIEGMHLKTGHILKLDRKDCDLQYWICLSPACDLVPGQKGKTGWYQRLQNWMPFKAVQLFEEPIERALAEANQANHLFLEIDGCIKAFSFCPYPASISMPKWEQMFANNQGIFNEGFKLEISVLAAQDNGEIEATLVQGYIIAQLRYEYALNLLQRLGNSLSRIGLDFIPYKNPSQSDS